jgi:hypothetical protein
VDKINIELGEEEMIIDGVTVDYGVLPHLLRAVIQPDPRRWLRFVRENGVVHVFVRLSEEEPHGTDSTTIGRRIHESEQNPRGQGQTATHP